MDRAMKQDNPVETARLVNSAGRMMSMFQQAFADTAPAAERWPANGDGAAHQRERRPDRRGRFGASRGPSCIDGGQT